jgi:hypothetical protein
MFSIHVGHGAPLARPPAILSICKRRVSSSRCVVLSTFGVLLAAAARAPASGLIAATFSVKVISVSSP